MSECLEMVEKDKYDIIFMDHMMPEMDGVEAYKAIREGNSINKHTPVIMLTGNADSQYSEMYKQLGIEGYIVKPALKDNVIRSISRILKEKTGKS